MAGPQQHRHGSAHHRAAARRRQRGQPEAPPRDGRSAVPWPLPVPRHRPVQDARRASRTSSPRATRAATTAAGVLRGGRRAARARAGRRRLPELLLPGSATPPSSRGATWPGGTSSTTWATSSRLPSPPRGGSATSGCSHVAVRFADLAVERFGPGEEPRWSADIPRSRWRWWSCTARPATSAYLDQARAVRGPARTRATVVKAPFPVRVLPGPRAASRADSVTGHAVRMVYLAAGATDVSLETRRPLDCCGALDRLWDDMAATKLYITGGLGSRHSDEAIGDRYELPSRARLQRDVRRDRHHAVGAGGMFRGDRRRALPGRVRARPLQRVRRRAFRGRAARSSTTTRCSAAPTTSSGPARRPAASRCAGPGSAVRAARRTSSAGWRSSTTTSPPSVTDALHITTYAGARIETGSLALAMETDYPWDGDVRIVVERAPDEPYAIRLRVPAWARSVTASVNGRPVEGAEDGWLTVERVWAAGDELRLGLPMPVRAHGSHPYLDATRGAVGVARGPLVYCVEQQDCPVPVDDLVVSRRAGRRRDRRAVAGRAAGRGRPADDGGGGRAALRRALPRVAGGTAGRPGRDGSGDLRPPLPLGQPPARSHARMGQERMTAPSSPIERRRNEEIGSSRHCRGVHRPGAHRVWRRLRPRLRRRCPGTLGGGTRPRGAPSTSCSPPTTPTWTRPGAGTAASTTSTGSSTGA